MGRGQRVVLLVVAVLGISAALAAPALADGPVGSDPSSNFAPSPSSPTCDTDPTGPVCETASVEYLDQARASLGLPPYQLPTSFVSLPADQQALVLTNLDRIQVGLPPFAGLTAALSQAAAGGVRAENDPATNDTHILAYTSNWADGYPNMPMAYGVWMYDDGPGSPNVDCTSPGSSACWGHRHDVLWNFGPGGSLAMGAATGTDRDGQLGYATLMAQGDSGYHQTYTYTWNQAVSAGAGGNALPALPGSSPGGNTTHGTFKLVSQRVHKRRLSFRVTASSGVSLQSSLVRRARSWPADRFRGCKTSKTYSGLRRGRYRLRIRAVGGSTITRYVTIR